ncbi:hypothetical protein [Actinocorallia sp. A-T 12471]|nr:hypothetical protein [Actinocorallia sp. A-T 12471]MDX6743813.1 hypothetical protein [Actinocorallia sp. A-T 12471]
MKLLRAAAIFTAIMLIGTTLLQGSLGAPELLILLTLATTTAALTHHRP